MVSSLSWLLPQKQDIFRSFSDEKTFFRITHVVKFAREYPQSLRPPTAGFIVLVAGATVGLIVPVLLFGAATISYATLPSVEMETKTEQRETAQHGFIHRMFDGIQYMFSGAPAETYPSSTRSSWRQLRHRIHSSLFTACMRSSLLKPQW